MDFIKAHKILEEKKLWISSEFVRCAATREPISEEFNNAMDWIFDALSTIRDTMDRMYLDISIVVSDDYVRPRFGLLYPIELHVNKEELELSIMKFTSSAYRIHQTQFDKEINDYSRLSKISDYLIEVLKIVESWESDYKDAIKFYNRF